MKILLFLKIKNRGVAPKNLIVYLLKWSLLNGIHSRDIRVNLKIKVLCIFSSFTGEENLPENLLVTASACALWV